MGPAAHCPLVTTSICCKGTPYAGCMLPSVEVGQPLWVCWWWGMSPAPSASRLHLMCEPTPLVGRFRSQSSWLQVPEGLEAGAGPLVGGAQKVPELVLACWWVWQVLGWPAVGLRWAWGWNLNFFSVYIFKKYYVFWLKTCRCWCLPWSVGWR